jgi:DNA-binding PadR family transcriptional regulator
MAGSDLFTGTLDILILKALTWGPRHGYAIGRWIRETTEDVLTVQEGALYPALHRLERRGVIGAKRRAGTRTHERCRAPWRCPPPDRRRSR